MKKIFYIIVPFFLIFLLFTIHITNASAFKWIRVGKANNRVHDSGSNSFADGGNFGYYYFDDFSRVGFQAGGWRIGCKDWYDENGTYFPVKLTGAPNGPVDEITTMMPVPDDEKITIRKYMRYQPPSIIVDGCILDEPFPMKGDEVNPDKIPGTADIMVESWINTSMGLNIHQRVLAWSQTHHDDYIIYEWTFKNTGNMNLDDEIELPEQNLKDVYILRQADHFPSINKKEWNSWYGQRPGDTLRIVYGYPCRSRNAKYDDLGSPHSSGYLTVPCYIGEAVLHVDKSVNDPTDDPAQPQMTAVGAPDIPPLQNLFTQMSPADRLFAYELMQMGFRDLYGAEYMEGRYPGTHHEVPQDERGVKFARDFSWWYWHARAYQSSGPYTFAPGDDIKYVFATVWGGISPEMAWKIGRAWLNGTCEPPEGCVFGVTDNLPPPYKQYPDLYEADSKSTEYNNWAKDCWVSTGKDSLFTNNWNAQWSVRNDFNVPIPPPPPSIEVNSRPDRIEINWGTESETAPDFAGYRVYRAIGNPAPKLIEDKLKGVWEPVFECGKGTSNALTHSYEDMDAERGQAYFYYVAAFDDGVGNTPDVWGQKESLESGIYLNRTTRAAYLTRPAGTLSTVRVVPNPYNIGAAELQYVGESNKIMFMDIPGYCTIKIYSESGDLVKTLYHTDGSGDESWGRLTEEHSANDSGQLIVSGIYIAVIEETDTNGTPTGNSTALKFVVVR